MKKNLFVSLFLFCIMTVTNIDAQTQTSGKILIVYFSMPETGGVDAVSGASRLIVEGKVTGNVEFVANCIQKAAGGDLFAIRTAQTYPGGHNQLLEMAQNEQKANVRPPLAAHISGLQNYDTIFVGYPIWWYPLYSFFDEYDFSGKTIIPFTVHGGSRFSGAIEKIIQLEPRAVIVKDGFAVSRNDVVRSNRDITAWLRKIGMVR